MLRPVDHIEAITGQVQVERLHERAGSEFPRHQYIAEDSDTLSCSHRFDGMQLLAEAQMLRIPEVGNVAPLALGCGQPSLPRRRLAVRRRPVAMDEDVIAKVGWPLQAPGRKHVRIVDRPERVAQKFLSYTVLWGYAPGRIPDGDISVPCLQIKHTVGADDFQRNVGMQFAPRGKAGHKPAAGKRVGRRYPKRLAVAILLDSGDRGSKAVEPAANCR